MQNRLGFLALALLISCGGTENEAESTTEAEADKYFIKVNLDGEEHLSSGKTEKDCDFGGDAFAGEANFGVHHGHLTIYEDFFETAEMDPEATMGKVYEAVIDIDGTTTHGKVNIKTVTKGSEDEETVNWDVAGKFKSDGGDKGEFYLSMPVYK
jgi:hypothetical protein